MEEQWKDIVIEKNGEVFDYTGLYQVSNLGRIRSLDRVESNGRKVKGKVLKCEPIKNGYIVVRLRKNGEKQQFSIHRLVATAFIPNPENLPVVNHRDECKTNNCVDNLEWVTVKYNTNYGTSRERASEKLKGQKRSDETRKKMSESHKGKYTGAKHPMAKKVICLETKQVFGCAKEANEWCGKTGVKDCCRGRSKTVGGYHWMYYEDYKRELRLQSDIKNSQLVA